MSFKNTSYFLHMEHLRIMVPSCSQNIGVRPCLQLQILLFFFEDDFLHDERKDIKTITTAVQLMIDADRYLVRSY